MMILSYLFILWDDYAAILHRTEKMSVNGSLPKLPNEEFMEMRGPIDQRTSFYLLVLLYSCLNTQQDLFSAVSFI